MKITMAMLTAQQPPTRRGRNKYGAQATRGFASKVEAARYAYLRSLELAGEIADLQTQPVFQVEPERCKSIKYTADFVYREARSGQWTVEDVKGQAILADASIRMRLFTAKFPQYQLNIVRRYRGHWLTARFGVRRRRVAA